MKNTCPIDPATRQPLPPRSQPGYYPDFHTLDQQKYWDAATRSVVLDRVRNVPPIRFFEGKEEQLMKAICDRVLPQDDRVESRRIPIVPRIDERLFTNQLDGYRFEGMPSHQDAYRLGIAAIDEMSRKLYEKPFADLTVRHAEEILKSIHDGKPAIDVEAWHKMPIHRFWTMLVQDCVEAYYAHPWAWDEIGFGGPAYPRGYMRLEHGDPEPWEKDEVRYAWEAPPDTLSDAYEQIGGMEGHLPVQGQGGTH